MRFKDDNGEFVNFIVGAAVGFVADVGFQVAVQVATGQEIDIDWSEAAGSAALGATGVGAVNVAANGMKTLKAAKKVKKEVEALKRIGEKQRAIKDRAPVKTKSRNPSKESKVEPSEKIEDIGGIFTKKTKTTPGNKPGQSRSEMEFVKNKDGNLIRSRKFSYDRGNKLQHKKPARGGPEGRPQHEN